MDCLETYNKETASTEDRIAWTLCQIIDDNAPIGWARYRFAAECIALNKELMSDLQELGIGQQTSLGSTLVR